MTHSSEYMSCIGEALKLFALWSDLFPGSSSSPLSNLKDIFAAIARKKKYIKHKYK